MSSGAHGVGGVLVFAAFCVTGMTGLAQVPAGPVPAKTGVAAGVPVERRGPALDGTQVRVLDGVLKEAQILIGRALFLRGFYAGGDLIYDVSGRVKGAPKVVDWTLAGADITKVSRRDAGELELEGVRVAIRYNPEQHVFERHPQKEARLRILLTVNDDAKALRAALTAMFAVGIDPALQRAMPEFWRHYFSPGLGWVSDDLTGQTIVPMTAPAGSVEIPTLVKKLESELTNEARQDRVKGTVQLRMTVGVDGIPRRIAIRQPLGYGLDARVVETSGRYRFHPGIKDGKAVAVEMVVNQIFE